MLPSLKFPGRVLAMVFVAAALNCLPITLPGGALFFLGSFASMPLVLALPAPWAILAAAIPAAVSIPIMGQPSLLILAALEAIWLVAARRAKWKSHVVHDLAFWAVLGAPTAYLLGRYVTRFTPDIVAVIVVKLVLNQMFAVTIASFLVRHSRLSDWLERSVKQRARVREIVFRIVVLLAVVPLAMVGVTVSAFVRVYLERADREVLFESSQRVARQMDLFLQMHEAAVTGVAGVLGRGGGDPKVLLEETRRAHPAFITMLVTDAAGRIVQTAAAAPQPGLLSLSVADRDYFTKARATRRPFVSGVFRGRGFGRDILVAISAPIYGPDGEFAGIVEASLEVWKFAMLVATEGATEEAMITLVDRDGRVIHADEGTGIPILANLRNYAQGDLLRTDATGKKMEFDHVTPTGVADRDVAYAASSAYGITVVSQRPVLAGLTGIAWVIALIVAVAAAIVGVAIVVTRATRSRVAVPLETFARAASRQAALRSVEPIRNPTADAPQEIAMVFNAFNDLAVKLNGTYMMLRQQNAELDHRVVERTQELEAARAEAVAASESKSTFLAMTSHEIRTPLNAIIGLADALGEVATDPVAISRLRTIRTSGERLLGVVNDLLDLSQVEAGKLQLRPQPVTLGTVCEDVRALFALRAEQQGLRLELELPEERPLWFEVDASRLQQVLINLVGNALKFTKTGCITLRVEAVAAVPERLRLRFAVCDTGPGISSEEQAKLFQPYVQLPGAATSEVRGTGLGLSISRRLVGLMGGTLGVSSQIGEGSEFYFTIEVPRCVAPVLAAAAAPAAVGIRVLAADDNMANREVLGSILESRCSRVELVDSAQAALRALEAEEFDAALIDLEMFDADGFSVARTVRSWTGAQASRRCRLIAFSAYHRDQIWSRCAEAGFDDFVEKPIDRRVLMQALDAARPSGAA